MIAPEYTCYRMVVTMLHYPALGRKRWKESKNS
ncbi:hypothetical protein MPL3356_380014 [Mesorhizobium plurifarium]|uniref:Uncharacterized protein n=1 Tax=Mesorhizobium plurifarium TaxID=69974 RepID=A0A090E341_MESPL|nr:hypothetical protein MPL3356_380014 [Mesorhizobium plurifarium]